MTGMKQVVGVAAGAVLAVGMASGVQASGTMSEDVLKQLQKIIEQQQQQLDHQAAEIAKLKEMMGGASDALEQKADKEELAALDVDKVVNSRFEQVNVQLYGHLNRAVLWADNGDASKMYFVDNSNSQSRLGVNAAVGVSDDLALGGKIEYGIKSNASYDVNQLNTNGATSVNWNLRHADVFLNSKTYGKISLGHGSTASDGTAEIDLSCTSVVAYSDLSAIGGGQLFYDAGVDILSELEVNDVYSNMDGLGRDDRLRYDTPSFSGFVAGGSAVSGDGYDAALRYSRQYGDTKVAAGVAWAKPADADPGVEYIYSGSMSMLFGNGLNVTFAGGLSEMEEAGRDDATFWYTKFGYRTKIWTVGETSFSVDYGENADVRQIGDDASAWSVAAVQDVSAWGTEFYLAFRQYKLDSQNEDLEDINSVMGGARVKF